MLCNIYNIHAVDRIYKLLISSTPQYPGHRQNTRSRLKSALTTSLYAKELETRTRWSSGGTVRTTSPTTYPGARSAPKNGLGTATSVPPMP